MIDPPVVSKEEDGEGRREGPQKRITRTPEELEQRRLHHLFAQNAVCGQDVILKTFIRFHFSNAFFLRVD